MKIIEDWKFLSIDKDLPHPNYVIFNTYIGSEYGKFNEKISDYG